MCPSFSFLCLATFTDAIYIIAGIFLGVYRGNSFSYDRLGLIDILLHWEELDFAWDGMGF